MRKQIAFLGVSIIIVFISCSQNTSNKESSAITNKDNQSQVNKNKNSIRKLDSINVVSLREEYNKGIIEIYNPSGDLWKSFELTDTFSSKDMIPFSLKADDRILVFRCIGRKDGFYAIIVDENKKTIKYIKDKISYFNYETWQNHIIKVFSVDFDNKNNPLKKEPQKNSIIVPFDNEQFYHPVEIKGNWLKVIDDDENSGWIKWVDEKGNLKITLYYEA